MTLWDPAAHHRLNVIADDLRGCGVIDVLQETVRRVWRYNVDRYAPSEIGDTSRSLGMTATENIRSLILQRLRSDRIKDLYPGVSVSGADNSLLVRAPGGVRLRMMKGLAADRLAEPNWPQFDWTSEVRLEAALSNHGNYIPVGVNDLLEGTLTPQGSADLLREVFLVWAGGARSPQTAGWLGFPTADVARWLAVEPLWWDDPDDIRQYEPVPDSSGGYDTFSTRPVAEPRVALKGNAPHRQASSND